MLWIFIGDVLEWLEHHRSVSGVQRVALELVFAARDREAADPAFRFGLCGFGTSDTTLAALPLDDTLRRLAPWHQSGEPPWRSAVARPYTRATPAAFTADWPPFMGRSDHLLFPGLVWTGPFQSLFAALAGVGAPFSVLVYDLIQVERPDLVGQATMRSFMEWLRLVVQTARTVFVSTAITGDAIKALADVRRWPMRSRVRVIQFGMSHLAPGSGPRSTTGGHVLCVGTIDRRKNQRLLVDVWRNLADMLPGDVPTLVLVGRVDRDSLGMDADALMRAPGIDIRQSVSDPELAALYAECRFTVFPSQAEGYGLPVAESLAFGKLCVASGLPEMREFAGDLAWYFSSGSAAEATVLVRRAIERPDLVAEAERRIAEEFAPPRWADCFETIRAELLDG